MSEHEVPTARDGEADELRRRADAARRGEAVPHDEAMRLLRGETLSDKQVAAWRTQSERHYSVWGQRAYLDDRIVALCDTIAALRAQLADARAELKRWDELRRAVAECTGQDSAAWPEHGNAPLAIASTVALQRLKLDQIARAASGEGASHAR